MGLTEKPKPNTPNEYSDGNFLLVGLVHINEFYFLFFKNIIDIRNLILYNVDKWSNGPNRKAQV